MITLRQMAVKANAIGATLTGDFSQVRHLVDEHDLVIGIWIDKEEADGVGYQVVKGQHLLNDILATGQPRNLSWTAIPCFCLEQAVALREIVGKADLH